MPKGVAVICEEILHIFRYYPLGRMFRGYNTHGMHNRPLNTKGCRQFNSSMNALFGIFVGVVRLTEYAVVWQMYLIALCPRFFKSAAYKAPKKKRLREKSCKHLGKWCG